MWGPSQLEGTEGFDRFSLDIRKVAENSTTLDDVAQQKIHEIENIYAQSAKLHEADINTFSIPHFFSPILINNYDAREVTYDLLYGGEKIGTKKLILLQAPNGTIFSISNSSLDYTNQGFDQAATEIINSITFQ